MKRSFAAYCFIFIVIVWVTGCQDKKGLEYQSAQPNDVKIEKINYEGTFQFGQGNENTSSGELKVYQASDTSALFL